MRERAPEFARDITNMGRFTSRNRLVTKVSHYLFLALLKVEYIYLYSTPHWMTRVDRKLEPWHLERLLSGRQKWEGYRIWIKTAFAPFLRDTLSNPNAEYTRFFDYQTVLKMVEPPYCGHAQLYRRNQQGCNCSTHFLVVAKGMNATERHKLKSRL